MTIEGYDRERVLLSYDASGVARAIATRVCQMIFGRRRVSDGSSRATYLEKGFIHRPGVVWVGQSVLVMYARRRARIIGPPPLPRRSRGDRAGLNLTVDLGDVPPGR